VRDERSAAADDRDFAHAFEKPRRRGLVTSPALPRRGAASETVRMAKPMVFDKAKWHYQGDFPADLEPDQAFVHTGLFLGWVIDAGLYGDEFAVLRSYSGVLSAFRTIHSRGIFNRLL
jgi:hypothetical protein